MFSQFGIETWVVVAGLIALTYLVVEGIYRYNLSGFRLYLIGLGFRVIIPLVAISFAALAQLGGSRAGGGLAFGIILISFFVASHVEENRIDSIRKTSPAHWNAWADKAMRVKQSSPLSRLLLPKIERIDS